MFLCFLECKKENADDGYADGDPLFRLYFFLEEDKRKKCGNDYRAAVFSDECNRLADVDDAENLKIVTKRKRHARKHHKEVKSPALLEKRLNHKEKESTQRGVIALSGLMFPTGFVISALDYRFGWSRVPLPAVITASVLFLIGYIAYGEVMRENAYLSRTVEVQEGQKVIDTGLYAIVRHPMYLATLIMFLPIPLVIGSFFGLIPFALYPVLIVIRILNEEKLLEEELGGYKEYKAKVKYRLIPFVW